MKNLKRAVVLLLTMLLLTSTSFVFADKGEGTEPEFIMRIIVNPLEEE